MEVLSMQGGARRVVDRGAGAVQLAADVRPGQPHRAPLASAVGGEARAQGDVVVDLEALTVQGGAREVCDGGAGAVQLAADVRPVHPYGAVGGAGAYRGSLERHPGVGA
jgi:hypothetical protein